MVRATRSRAILRSLSLLGAVALIGCDPGSSEGEGAAGGTDGMSAGSEGSGSTSGDPPAGTSSASASSGELSTTGDDSTTGDESSTGDDSGETPSACESMTGDVQLQDVTVFQTVGIPIVQGCEEVSADDRAAPLVAGKESMLRASVELTESAPAQLAVHATIGATTHEGACTARGSGASLDLHVALPASSVTTDATYAVDVVDCGGGGSAVLAAFPGDASADLGAQDNGTMRIHIVPFEKNGFTPDTSQAVLDGFREAVIAHYPVADVQLTVLPVVPDAGGGVDVGELNTQLVQIQEDMVFASGDFDPSVADIYYYGLVSGVATREEFSGSTGTSEAGVGDRAGCAVGAAFADALSESTLIHELGHLHGLLHSPCGEPPLQDEDYPHADGSTQSEGWDARSSEFVPADHNDLMGYCQPRWVSSYHYAKMAQWVDLANSWAP